MKKVLVMKLFSRVLPVGAQATRQISALSSFEHGLFRPDKCDAHEPMREAFDPVDMEAPSRWLSTPGGQFMYRSGKPIKVLGWIRNQRLQDVLVKENRQKSAQLVRAVRQPVFVNEWNMFMDGSWLGRIGIDKAKAFALEMFRVSNADYGFLTPELDLDAKNYIDVAIADGRSKGYQGLDLEQGLPGLYWLNLFSRELAAWLRIEALSIESGVIVDTNSSPVQLQFGESPEASMSQEMLSKQIKLINALGKDKFFDASDLKRSLSSPNWAQLQS